MGWGADEQGGRVIADPAGFFGAMAVSNKRCMCECKEKTREDGKKEQSDDVTIL